MSTLTGFNAIGRPRRKWGDGTFSDSFSTEYSIFKTSTPAATMRPLSYVLHPWVRSAMDQPGVVANPEKPRMFALQDDELVPVGLDGKEGNFERGDVVWMSFILGYIVGGSEWYPDLRPIDYVRVGHVSTGHPAGGGMHHEEAIRLATGKVTMSGSNHDSDDESTHPKSTQEAERGGTGASAVKNLAPSLLLTRLVAESKSASSSSSTLSDVDDATKIPEEDGDSALPWLLTQTGLDNHVVRAKLPAIPEEDAG